MTSEQAHSLTEAANSSFGSNNSNQNILKDKQHVYECNCYEFLFSIIENHDLIFFFYIIVNIFAILFLVIVS